jgi:hypothetical protein
MPRTRINPRGKISPISTVHNVPVVRFKRNWWAALDYEFTPYGYCDDETYDRLPPLPEHLFTGDFAWLTAQAAGADAYYMEPGPMTRPALHLADRQLARAGLALPTSFVTFMSSAELRRRVPSGTRNGWELSNLAPSPAQDQGFLLRFMHDQQGCWFFYLYLAPDGSSPVLGSIDLFTPEQDGDDDRTLTAAEFMKSATWMAPDFEQFLYRYWVDNVVWHHAVNQNRPVSDLPLLAQQYVKLLHTPDRPPLDVWPPPLQWSNDSPDQLKLW